MLLIYSGGLDSTSALYIFKDRVKLAISFDYGSKHNPMEIECARVNCAKLGIPHKVIPLTSIGTHLKSSLLDRSVDVPHGHYAEDNMRSTVVPFRNGIMLSIAAGIAESNNISTIMLASHRGDHAQYPDCTPLFNAGIRAAINAGTNNKVELFTPFENMDKRQIAEEGVRNKLDPALTYSCYEGDTEHCGKCGTCVERIWALKNSFDPTTYKDKEFAIKVLKGSKEW